eukprot:CAMPEP_0176416240 /NCGR_PEP_ID=MMETSP0127-20121128/6239_1 /TAXON_ID=938130 /ORGANISM="Platyophrya macrostoma, Strain WH" /LENGTH=403 /DNA_ID=CAMNT_0017796299 /DNA_START=172 /DNA_END=1383 /DNA_ORIENTATION=-
MKTVIIGNLGFENKKPADSSPTRDPTKPESYVLTEQPITSVMDFFENFTEFEAKYDQFSGIVYTLIGSVLLGVLMFLRGEFLTRLPSVEVIFLITMITLVLNYFLLNGALYKPFIENEENSFNSKVAGILGIVAVIAFYYSLNFVGLYPALVLLYLGFALVMFIEKFYSNVTYTQKEMALNVLAFIGAIMVLNVVFTTNSIVDSSTVVTPTPHTLEAADSNHTQPAVPVVIHSDAVHANNPFAGLCLAALAGVSIAMIFLITHKMKYENKTTISYIFSLLMALFLPIFFPMQGVVKPTIHEAIWVIICGVLGELAMLIMVRAAQIERTGKVGVVVLVHLVWLYLIRILFGFGLHFSAIIGCALIIVSTLYFCQEGRAIIQARRSFLISEHRKENKSVELQLLH